MIQDPMVVLEKSEQNTRYVFSDGVGGSCVKDCGYRECVRSTSPSGFVCEAPLHLGSRDYQWDKGSIHHHCEHDSFILTFPDEPYPLN